VLGSHCTPEADEVEDAALVITTDDAATAIVATKGNFFACIWFSTVIDPVYNILHQSNDIEYVDREIFVPIEVAAGWIDSATTPTGIHRDFLMTFADIARQRKIPGEVALRTGI